LEPSRNSRRRVLLRNSQELASANGIARDGAREENRSGTPDLRLLLLPENFVGVGRRPANCHYEKCQGSWQLLVSSTSVASLMRRSRLRAWWSRKRRAGQSSLAPGGKGR